MDKIRLISLSVNKELADDIAKYLGIQVTESTLKRFADGEILFNCDECIRGDDIYIIQSTCSPANDTLMEVLICVDACKRAGAKSITCVIPYYGYSRQDRKGDNRQSVSAKLVADLLTAAGVNRLLCVDLHATQIVGFFNFPVDNLSPVNIFEDRVRLTSNVNNLVCVSPDHGGLVRTTKLATKLNAPIAIIDKRRPEPNKSEIVSIVGSVKDKDCIIVDDIVDTAGTLCNAANELKKLGARSVMAFITHGVLSEPAVDRIRDSGLDYCYITDSIPLTKNKKCNKIIVLSLAEVLANAINSLEKGLSLGGN
jgi:ribose-phosphate pyrophosphokinase